MPPKESTNKQCNVYTFRCNQDYFTEDTMMTFLHKIAKKFVFQLEEGEERKDGADHGYYHWQGRLSLWKTMRLSELKNLIRGMDVPLFNYLQPTTREEHKKEAFYETKEQTRVRGPWTDQSCAAYLPRQFRNLELYGYQKAIIEKSKDFNDREINCIIDTDGCQGKSTIAALAELVHGGIDVPCVNDMKELVQIVCDICISKKLRAPSPICIDLPRAINQQKLAGLYSGIEQIKKGKLYDTRNCYKDWWIDSPSVWVFCNEQPKISMLSRDRWRFWKIVDKELVEYFEECENENENDLLESDEEK